MRQADACRENQLLSTGMGAAIPSQREAGVRIKTKAPVGTIGSFQKSIFFLPPYGMNGRYRMDRNVVRWGVDLAMGMAFVISFATGLLKFTVLLRLTGVNGMILPSAFISDLHDRSGVLLGLLVFLHLFLNRKWLVAMTRQVLGGEKADA
jgi:hypothetical protein